MYANRKDLYGRLEEMRGSKVICFVTGDKPGMETQIHSDVFDYFVNHLDILGVVPKISLFMYTRGGDTLTAWSLINLIRQFCDELEVIIPSKCLSAGTIMSLGANSIIMTKQATLGPIDPSITTQLNPSVVINGQEIKLPVSVEDIKGYLALATDELKITDQESLAQLLLSLGEKVHPLVLGKVYRSKSQIQMLASKLLSYQIDDPEQITKIVSFLCSDSGSHDYTISRREAENELGLNIEKPGQELYELIKEIYEDIKEELKLGEPFVPAAFLGQSQEAAYSLPRVLVEAKESCSYQFRTDGTVRIVNDAGQLSIQHNVTGEGWGKFDD
ncbi:serine protease [Klebsiella variicola]|uniref:SDH family Clp fold serine proteinase n=1 Tax=Klebsiella variicola TaxID=244366 RepID=UPI0018A948BA|nr:serine protease [Klebsiella variicola]MBF8479374.1 serine protease [Klebsiella variicola]HDZ2780257.1 serine protease [Klebsiella pneumoniae]